MTLNIKLKRVTLQRKKAKNREPEPKSIDVSTRAHKVDCDWVHVFTVVNFDWYVRFSFAKILTRSRNGNEARSTTLRQNHYSHEMIGLLFGEQWEYHINITQKHELIESRAMQNANAIFLEFILETQSEKKRAKQAATKKK